MEFLVKQCSVGYDKVIQSGNRCCCCRRTVDIFTCRRRNTICYRSMRITAIWSSACLSAQRNIRRYRIKSFMELSSTWIMIFLKRTCIGICNISCKIIHIIDGISEFRNFIDHIMQFCKFLNLLIGRFQSHNCLKNCFCCIFVDSHSCILHSLENHF